MALPALPECAILATGGQLLDYGILHHIGSVLAIELERVQSEHERMLRLGSELVDDLLNMRLTERAALERLEQLGCPPGSTHLVLARLVHAAPDNWQLELGRQNIKALARQAGEELVILMTDQAAYKSLQAVLGCSLGISAVLGSGLRVPEALREARLALAHSTPARMIVDYANALDEAFWLPSDLEQANRMYRRVIGSLADYDAQNGSHLIHTLKVFLEQNRSWQKSAQALYVHKETLVYRLRRIEEISGRSLDDTEGVVALWIALRSMDIAADGHDAGSLGYIIRRQ
ncbi:Purine catabolism regulatory protein [compost metagenome]